MSYDSLANESALEIETIFLSSGDWSPPGILTETLEVDQMEVEGLVLNPRFVYE